MKNYINKTYLIIENLTQILNRQGLEKIELIKSVQNQIWNEDSCGDKDLDEILSGIAYDLDFYEQNEEWRKENPSYYGDERLIEGIKLAIEKLQQQNIE
jgi:hypothetical protein